MINRLFELIAEFADGKQTVFAAKAGIPKGTFHGYLKGRTPQPEHLIRIRETFSISIDWILTGEGSKYIPPQGEAQVLDPDPEIAGLMEGARRVLTSGNPIAFDALERNIRYFDHAINAEKQLNEMKDDMEFLKKEFAKLKLENQRLDEEEEVQSSNEKAA